jgi:hypothetical protein
MASLVHEVLEYFSHVVIVGSLLKLQIPAIVEIGIKFLWKSSSQRFNGRAHFLVLDPIVLVILVFALKSLPRKRAL